MKGYRNQISELSDDDDEDEDDDDDDNDDNDDDNATYAAGIDSGSDGEGEGRGRGGCKRKVGKIKSLKIVSGSVTSTDTVWYRVSFDTQYVLGLSLILMMFYVWFRVSF